MSLCYIRLDLISINQRKNLLSSAICITIDELQKLEIEGLKLDWYEKLEAYFPEEEMKSIEQFDALFTEKNEIYFKEVESEHIVVYAEFTDFIFIDYLWVSPSARGKGIGRQVIEKFKEKNKAIILEVEPIDEKDPDTSGRLKFYYKIGFQFAKTFSYLYQANNNGEEIELNIMYYAANPLEEKQLYQWTKRIHEEIHSYKEFELYGVQPQTSKEVLKIKSHHLVNEH